MENQSSCENVQNTLLYKMFKNIILGLNPSHVITTRVVCYGFETVEICESFTDDNREDLWNHISWLFANPESGFSITFRVREIDIEAYFRFYEFNAPNLPWLGNNVACYELNVSYNKSNHQNLFLGVSKNGIEIHDYEADEVLDGLTERGFVKLFKELFTRNVSSVEKIAQNFPPTI